MTYQKCVMKETKEKCMKKGRQYYEKKKERLQKMICDQCKACLRKKKMKVWQKLISEYV